MMRRSEQVNTDLCDFVLPQAEVVHKILANAVGDAPGPDEITSAVAQHYGPESVDYLLMERPQEKSPILIASPEIDDIVDYGHLLERLGESFSRQRLIKKFGRIANFNDYKMAHENVLDGINGRLHRMLIVSGFAVKFVIQDSERDLARAVHGTEMDVTDIPDNPGQFGTDMPVVDATRAISYMQVLDAKRNANLGTHGIDLVDYAVLRAVCRRRGLDVPDAENTATMFTWNEIKNHQGDDRSEHELPRLSQSASTGELKFSIAKNSFRDNYSNTFVRMALIN